MSKYTLTPEPWQIHGTYLYGPGPERIMIASFVNNDGGTDLVGNLRRARVCVNDCAGIVKPGEAIQASRAAMRRILAITAKTMAAGEYYYDQADAREAEEAIFDIGHALALLGEAKENDK